MPLCLNSFRSVVPAVSAHDATHRRKIATVEGWTMRCWRRGRWRWEKDVVRENERVLVVRERAWKGKKARQQCFGGGGDLEGRERRDWERERTGLLFCEKRVIQNGRLHTMCHKPFYLKI